MLDLTTLTAQYLVLQRSLPSTTECATRYFSSYLSTMQSGPSRSLSPVAPRGPTFSKTGSSSCTIRLCSSPYLPDIISSCSCCSDSELFSSESTRAPDALFEHSYRNNIIYHNDTAFKVTWAVGTRPREVERLIMETVYGKRTHNVDSVMMRANNAKNSLALRVHYSFAIDNLLIKEC